MKSGNRPLVRVIRRHVGDTWMRLPHVFQTPSLRRRHKWAIGIFGGPDLCSLGPVPGIRNPVLSRTDVTDVDADFVADPFLLSWAGREYMFFEVLNRETGLGEIGVASSPDLRQWQYEGIALREPHHLSYPFVFDLHGEPHMLVESEEVGLVRLYRAEDFPRTWVPALDLVEGVKLSDPTLLRHHGRWYLFACGRGASGRGRLNLFVAPTVRGPFVAHPASPIVADSRRWSRPAGRIVADGSRFVRFAQDCSREYGEAVFGLAITELTETTYREELLQQRPVLKGSGVGWNRAHMHHIDGRRLDDGTWIAAVDGW